MTILLKEATWSILLLQVFQSTVLYLMIKSFITKFETTKFDPIQCLYWGRSDLKEKVEGVKTIVGIILKTFDNFYITNWHIFCFDFFLGPKLEPFGQLSCFQIWFIKVCIMWCKPGCPKTNICGKINWTNYTGLTL